LLINVRKSPSIHGAAFLPGQTVPPNNVLHHPNPTTKKLGRAWAFYALDFAMDGVFEGYRVFEGYTTS